MDIEASLDKNWIVIKVRGRIDSFNYEIASERLKTILKIGKTKLALELSDVSFLNLASLRLISSIATDISDKKGAFAVVTKNSKVIRALQRVAPEGIIYCESLEHVPSGEET